VVAAIWFENNLHVFRRSSTTGGNLFHQMWDGQQWQPGPTDWQNIGGELYSDSTVVRYDSGFDIYAVGSANNMIRKRWFSGAWYPGPTDWEIYGEKVTRTIGAAARVDITVDLFYVGLDNNLYQKENDVFQFYPGKKVGGPIAGSPAAFSTHPNVFGALIVGPDKNLLRKTWNFGDWVPAGDDYEDLGGELMADPAVLTYEYHIPDNPPGPLDVFAVGTNRNLLHKKWDGTKWLPGPRDWDNLGGQMHGTPAAVSLGDNLVDVVVPGPDNRLYHTSYNGFQWRPLQNLGVTALDSPAMVSPGPTRLDIFYTGSDGGVHQKTWDKTWWLPWEDRGGADL
jgi:hypothetical protein